MYALHYELAKALQAERLHEAQRHKRAVAIRHRRRAALAERLAQLRPRRSRRRVAVPKVAHG